MDIYRADPISSIDATYDPDQPIISLNLGDATEVDKAGAHALNHSPCTHKQSTPNDLQRKDTVDLWPTNQNNPILKPRQERQVVPHPVQHNARVHCRARTARTAIQPHTLEALQSTVTVVPCSRRGKRIYHLAPVVLGCWEMDDYFDRFSFVQGELKRAVDSDHDLRDRARFINYSLCMVGTTLQTALPSIIVECQSADVKPLRRLFKKKAREKLYVGKRSRLFKWFKERPTPKPPFELVYFRSDQDPLNRKSAPQMVVASLAVRNTLCGALVEYQGRVAHVGLTFRVAEEVYSTTVEHIFEITSRSNTSQGQHSGTRSIANSESEQCTVVDEDLVSLDPLWSDDSDDDDDDELEPSGLLEYASEEPLPVSPTIGNTHSPLERSPAETLESGLRSITGERILEPVRLPFSAPFLDFALLRFDAAVATAKEVNTLYLHGLDQPLIKLDTIADQPRFHGVPVFIISSIGGIRSGKLLKGYSYLGSDVGQDTCEVWTLILNSQKGLLDGECGSVVVDCDTSAVYGHVVGSNPLNHAYVVPYKHIVQQIKTKFATSQVHLVTNTDYIASESARLDTTPQNFVVSEPSDGLNQSNTIFTSQPNVDTMGTNATKDKENTLKVTIPWNPILSLPEVKPLTAAMGATCRNMAAVQGDEFETLRTHINNNLRVRSYDGRFFVPQAALLEHLDRDRVKRLLETCQTEKHRYDTIRERYLAVFAVLALIGKGTYIGHFLNHSECSDTHLPIRLEDLPRIGDDSYQMAFVEAQWAFCAPQLGRNSLNNKLFDARMIVPIISSEILRKDPDSTSYKIQIHPDYDRLTSETHIPNHFASRPFYVLKTRQPNHAKLHQNEVQAYGSVWNHECVLSSVSQFYGSWRQSDTNNILLEYIDGRSLSKYFCGHHPKSDRDVFKLWENMGKLIQALDYIHDHVHMQGHDEAMGCVHQDIKPDNILVSQTNPHSAFDVIFKLADLGMAYIPPDYGLEKAGRRINRHQTQVFSPPECFRDEVEPANQSATRQVNLKMDIWSLGCVFSELVVWSVLGSRGRDEYQRLRIDATNEIKSMKYSVYSGCFHDGEEISSAVHEMHDRVRMKRSAVTELLPIIEDMLDPDEKQRPDAFTIERRFRRTLNNARRAISANETHWSGSLPDVHEIQDSRPLSPPPSPPRQYTRIVDSSTDESLRITPYVPRVRSAKMNLSQFQPKPGHRAASAIAKEKPMQVSRSSSWMSPSLRRACELGGFEEREKIPVYASSSPQIALHNSAVGFEEVEKFPDGIQATHGRDDNRMPSATIAEVIDWIKSRKGRRLAGNQTPVSELYLTALQNRDQIFVIDNSMSMKMHRTQVREVFESLAYLVKGLDPDGIDLHFTMSGQSAHGYHRENLLKLFDMVRFDGQSSMELALSAILESPGRKRWNRPMFHDKKPRGKSIYVLTDGKWHGRNQFPDGMPELIKRLVDKLGSKTEVGIQFIQFGDDEVGTSRLRMLDDDLGTFGVNMDIIDTEHSTGNVYKMLLGHVSSSWDHIDTDTSSMSMPARQQKVSSRPTANFSNV